ncbi:hypothetical protein GGR56DRAFT_324842 [Xylariaceae sp. FL0804]|nr:hypothetical protein GGR56DRAFT_324842 [Xylariaceae sp. FL0804]
MSFSSYEFSTYLGSTLLIAHSSCLGLRPCFPFPPTHLAILLLLLPRVFVYGTYFYRCTVQHCLSPPSVFSVLPLRSHSLFSSPDLSLSPPPATTTIAPSGSVASLQDIPSCLPWHGARVQIPFLELKPKLHPSSSSSFSLAPRGLALLACWHYY